MAEGTWTHWHHAPPHSFAANSTYFITAATLHKARVFNSPAKLDMLVSKIFEQCESCRWELDAWAVFSNHYHLMAHAGEESLNIKALLRRIHSVTARELNLLDNAAGRKVWHNYRETQLTYEKSYYARLHYVHDNPVRHGLVPRSENYRWCSMGWFVQRGEATFVRKVLSFKTDSVNVEDDFDPV